MKKFGSALLMGLSVLFLGSCVKDSYRHGAELVHPAAGYYSILYADQTEDSVVFNSFDSYTVSTDASWIKVDSAMAAMKVENSYWYWYEFHVPLTMTPNTTGISREGIVNVKSFGDDDWNTTLQASYLQLPCHNVLRPAPDYGEYTTYPKTATFELKDSAFVVLDSLKFHAYDDWTLSQQSEDFVHFNVTSGTKGMQVIKLTLDENTASKDRVEKLTLTSKSGFSTEIKVTQLAVKEDK